MRLLKDKKFRYGTLSTVMILFAAALFLLVNLVAGQFDFTRDLTQNKMYSLSSYSKDYLANELDQDVNIYALFRTGQEDLMLKQILEEYAAASPHISLTYRDPLLYPTFVEQFAQPDEKVADNSVIVQGANKHKVIAPSDMFTYEYDYNTFQQYVTSIDFEPQISKAIQFVTLDDAPKVYLATGDNELPLPENLQKLIGLENFQYAEVDLVLNDIPEDCDMLLFTMPGRDWSKDKADRILAFLQDEGRAVFLLGYQAERFANMDTVLAAYGVRVGDYVVLEGDTNRYYMGNPAFTIPGYAPGEITQPMIDKKYPVLFIQPTGIEELAVKRGGTEIAPIVTTSAAAYGKTNPEAASVNKEPGDADGPFNLGVTVTDTWYSEAQHTTKLAVIGCEFILEESVNEMIGGTNWDLIINSLHWLSEQPTSIYIPSKSANNQQNLVMSQSQANTIALLSAIVLPLAFVITGAVVWFRRRHS